MSYTRERLGELLVSAGLIDEAQLAEALEIQGRDGGKLGEVLVRRLIATEDEIASTLARQKGLAHVRLTGYPVSRTAVGLIPIRMATMHQVFPIGFDEDRLLLAMADPLDVEAIDDVQVRAGVKVTPVVAGRSEVLHAIEKYMASPDAVQDVVDSVAETEAASVELASGEDVPVVRLVNQMIRDAVGAGASDLHIEPEAGRLAVRFRVDGVLHEIMELPVAARAGITSRIKIMAELDIAERRRPQDGRIALVVEDRPVDIRVASLPTPYGEALTLRILNAELQFRVLEEVGLSKDNFEQLTGFLTRPYGAVLISGPTGSGKSTTLYAALQRLNCPNRKIITVEDPIEYRLSGATQMAVNPRIGLTFASGLRTILRADPDIVMVGEIRDPETTEIAIRAALTGHLVLSSVHTNDAPSALTRVVDMGVPAYITSSALLGVVAQRLVRVLCEHCKQPVDVPLARLVGEGFTEKEAKKLKVFGPVGCDLCSKSGYRGRVGVFEIMPMSDAIVRAFLDSAPSERLREIALAEGMVPLRRDALNKVAAGITSLEEMDRVVM